LKAGELRHDVRRHVGLKFDAEFRKKLYDAAELNRGLASFHFADEYGTHARASCDIIQSEPLGFAGSPKEETQLLGGANFHVHGSRTRIDAIASILFLAPAWVKRIDAIASIHRGQ
jgi:hypothetical protein